MGIYISNIILNKLFLAIKNFKRNKLFLEEFFIKCLTTLM